ncbi:hypothetical protein MKW94_022262 [Papaver nudicaule]|uniref:AB hydrolase-1 domain-containing protein n=1 Tax=Papaver nudicaule TaxID=74823 RepID=A0AA41VMU5_PAPNU|nr:hypothetical protein [Papaver nudicaule]
MEPTASCFSLISFVEKFHRKAFKSSNLALHTIKIDSETTIQLWSPTPSSKTTVCKPSLVLIHGFGFNPLWQWYKQVKLLSIHFSLYIPELIFTGKSTTTSSERTEIFQAVSLGKVMETLGVETYSVLGSSYGGFVAYHMARLFPQRVERVVIANSAINLRLKDNEELLKNINFEKIEDLLMPVKASQLRMLMSLTYYKPPFSPDFLLRHIIKVSMEVIKKTAHEPQLENPKLFNDTVMNFLSPRKDDKK